MAYDGEKLNLIAQGIGGTGKVYHYISASDQNTVIGGASAITDGSVRGLKAGDVVMAQDGDTNNDMDVFPVDAVTVGGAADLGDAI